MSDFNSLTLALEDWFGTPRSELPEALRLRVEREIYPMPWDQLSAGQRRSLALQLDYQHDPATEQDRQFWWDFYERKGALAAQISQWEAAKTPTAGDLALRESRLDELRRMLASMELQERREKKSRGDYYPMPKQPETESKAPASAQDSPVSYVAYPKAMHQLVSRHNATPEELAAWVFLGPRLGGIAAYLNANELDPPPQFHFSDGFVNGEDDGQDYVSPLMACWFRTDDIASFLPARRYITGSALIGRWGAKPGIKAAAFIRAKVRESRLQDLHPIFGGTLGGMSDDPSFPPLTSALFSLMEVETIESEDFAEGGDRKHEQAGAPMLPVDLRQGAEGTCVARSDGGQGEALPEPASASTSSDARAATGSCSAFIEMKGLDAIELNIAFVGEMAEGGLGANNMLEITARGVTRRVPLAALDLVDRRSGALNRQGGILLGISQRMTLLYTPVNAQKMTRLRRVFKQHLGVDHPFDEYRTGYGWTPRFTIEDKRGAADERAKFDAQRRTVSLDQLAERGAQEGGDERIHSESDDDDDQAAAWLREKDPDSAT